MSVQDLIGLIGQQQLPLAIFLVVPPLLAWMVGFCHQPNRGGLGTWRYVYTVLIYAVCFPGIAAAVLTAYSLFFLNRDLTQVNFLVYLAPILSMVLTLTLIARNADFDDIPGFERISGLMLVIAVSFALTLAVQRMFVAIFFHGGSVLELLAILGTVFGLIKWGLNRALGRAGSEHQDLEPR